MNIWKAIEEKFRLDAAEAEKKNVRTAYGRYLRKKKHVTSGSERDVVPSPSEFSNLDWLSNHINQRPSAVSNVQSRDESEDDADHVEEVESINSVQTQLNVEKDQVRMTCNLKPLFLQLLILCLLLLLLLMMVSQTRVQNRKGNQHQRSPNQPLRDHRPQTQGKQRTVT